jgi:hypothetical protein
LKLEYDEPLSNFAFNFNLRRYTEELPALVEAELPAAKGLKSITGRACRIMLATS